MHLVLLGVHFDFSLCEKKSNLQNKKATRLLWRGGACGAVQGRQTHLHSERERAPMVCCGFVTVTNESTYTDQTKQSISVKTSLVVTSAVTSNNSY